MDDVTLLSLVSPRRSTLPQGGMRLLRKCSQGLGDNQDIHLADTSRGRWAASKMYAFCESGPRCSPADGLLGVP
jgi:hypothetical protein